MTNSTASIARVHVTDETPCDHTACNRDHMLVEVAPAAPVLADFYSDPFPANKGTDRITEDCGKCQGTGLYAGYTGWTDSYGRPYCFDCNGTGKRSFLVSSARAAARKQAKARLQMALERIATEAAEGTFEAEHPGLLGWLEQFAGSAGFLGDMASKPVDRLTPKMIAAIERIRDERAAEAVRKSEAAPMAEGRRTLEGVVKSVKETWNDFGSQWKMTVELEGGYRVYGSIARGLDDAISALPLEDGAGWYDRLIGQRVQFTAAVERSRDDNTFGFFSRPTKASLLG